MTCESTKCPGMNVLKKLYDWTVQWAKTAQASYALFAIAFIESSFFPVPPDVLLIAMTVAKPHAWWRNALICTAGSVLGALFGYFIGWGLYETVGRWIVTTYHFEGHMATVGKMYADNAFWAIFTAAFTPIPYKVFTLAAGIFKIGLPVLICASIVGRAGRFFLVAGLLRLFGEKIDRFIQKYFDILSILFVILLVGSYFLVKYLAH